MTLSTLAAACGASLRGADAEASGITHVAQRVKTGWVFAALPGKQRHGIEFAEVALAQGAVAVLSDREPRCGIPWLHTLQPRRSTALAAWALSGHPERRVRMVGVTGTNGKSTVVDLIGLIARTAGERAGVFGTIGYSLPNRSERAARTTPEAPDLAPLLAELADNGGTIAVMEVSSHGLALDRVAGLEFDVAVWTNLTRDHLDFHPNLEAYFAAKASLATMLRHDPLGRRVIGTDDLFMARLAASPRAGDLSFGFGATCAVTALHVSPDFEGSSFHLHTPEWEKEVRLPLVGRHNVRNALAAAAASVALGWPADAIVHGLAAAQPLPGRLESVAAGTTYPVFVDYAHTPDGLEQVLLALREIGERRLVVVFGCGGDRDPGKRAPMGETVGRLADVPIVTTDNPRSEDPEAIIGQVLEGVRASGNPRALAIADRREAIAAALSLADDRCLVLIAGKGHETEQIFADRTVPFDDRAVARELAQRRRA